MKNRRKQGKIFRSLLAVLMLTAMLVTSVLQPVFAGDYVAGTKGNLTLTMCISCWMRHWLPQQSILIPSRRLMAGMKRQRSWRL